MYEESVVNGGKALVICSGGQDSTTCLGWALDRWAEVEAIHFVYGQKHSVETGVCIAICAKLKVKLQVINLDFLPQISVSALTSDGDVNKPHPLNENLPASFVPNRNALFISAAHAYAQKIGAKALITGVCETDYSGYPDCRQLFIEAIGRALNLGALTDIWIQTPLMFLSKAGTFALAEEVGVLDIVINDSHTCYEGKREVHDWGKGCGECPACKLREKGWKEFSRDRV